LLNYHNQGKVIYLVISDYFEVKSVTLSCCGTKNKNGSGEKEMEIPEPIQKELDALGGFEALARRIPLTGELETKSRVYHALADPLRLTILYLLRDQPLCVCVINRFMRLAGSKLSYHLNILKESGLINGEYHGNWIIYSLTEKGRKLLTIYI
jgi:ArsR family transcriptional regulator, arsenate/arsenite/antimonite-responsive transcriptional repressor